MTTCLVTKKTEQQFFLERNSVKRMNQGGKEKEIFLEALRRMRHFLTECKNRVAKNFSSSLSERREGKKMKLSKIRRRIFLLGRKMGANYRPMKRGTKRPSDQRDHSTSWLLHKGGAHFRGCLICAWLAGWHTKERCCSHSPGSLVCKGPVVSTTL